MATQETKEGLGYIIQAINNIIEPKVETLRYDKTYRAKITEIIEPGIYKVQLNGIEYELSYHGVLNVGDIVKVKAPLGNFSDIYIEAIPDTSGESDPVDYNDLLNKPILDTSNTNSQETQSNEIIRDTIKLHKISKTGNYNDLIGKPELNFIPTSEKGIAGGVAALDANSKLSPDNLPIATTEALGAAKIGDGLDVTKEGVVSVNVDFLLPIGTVIPFAGNVFPSDNWLVCDGSTFNPEIYPKLYETIGNRYGEGTNSAGKINPKVPDLQGRTIVGGKIFDDDFGTLGATGGEKTHTLTAEEMPSHDHLLNLKSIQFASGTGSWAAQYSDSGQNIRSLNTGGGQAHNNMPPYIVLNYIIRAK